MNVENRRPYLSKIARNAAVEVAGLWINTVISSFSDMGIIPMEDLVQACAVIDIILSNNKVIEK